MDNEIIQLVLGPGGVLVLFMVIVFTGMKRKWVFGWQYEECVNEKNEWKEAALRGTRVAERVVTISEAAERRDKEGQSGV